MNLRVFYLTRRGISDGYEQRLVLRNPLSEKALFLLVCSCLGETENGFIAMFPYDI